MTRHLRPDRALLGFSGPDAGRLINDVVTGHLPETGEARWFALLSPQGKMLAEGTMARHGETYYLDVDQSLAEDFFKRMRLYRLRAAVEIADLRETHVLGWSATLLEGICAEDRRGPVSLGYAIVLERGASAGFEADGTGRLAARIAACIPELVTDVPAGEPFAHDFGMDALDGIDFAKGCYVGQEVVSRMKHRGTARRRPVIVTAPGVPAGTPILVEGRAAGTVGAVLDGRAVGIVRLDRVVEGATITVGNAPATLALPRWAPYAFGESGADD